MRDEFLQVGHEAHLSTSAADAPIVHQQEGLIVTVQVTGVLRRVLKIIPGREAALREEPAEHGAVSVFRGECLQTTP